MKHIYYYLVLYLGFCFSINAQCVRGISTNPANPVNSELSHLLNANTTINPWLNTFDWGETNGAGFTPIVLEPNAGWMVPDFIGGIFTMVSPYQSGGSGHYEYLFEPVKDFQARDFHWEDGWELLWLGTGFYPNGEPIASYNAARIFPNASSVNAKRSPYFVLYNRYRGVMRVFLNVFAPLGEYENCTVELVFANYSNGTGNLSGSLRLLNGLDQALDRPTSAVLMRSQQAMSVNVDQWMAVDFQMAYDPCVCEHPSKLRINVSAWETLQIDLYGRGVSLEVPIADSKSGTSTYDRNFLSVHAIKETAQSGGQAMYHKTDKLIEDYQNRLQLYNQDLKDYNSLENSIIRLGLNSVKDYLNTGVLDYGNWASTLALLGADIGLTPASKEYSFRYGTPSALPQFPKEFGVIPAGPYYDGQQIAGSNFIVDLRVNNDTVTMRRYDYGSIEKDIKSNAGKLLGSGFDMLSMQLFPKAFNKPVRPSTPSASYTEMRFTGTIVDKDDVVSLGPFYTPGSYKAGMDISPFNYPAYDEAMGVFALLETPKFKVYQAEAEWEWKGRFQDWEGEPMPGADYEEWRFNKELLLKLDAPLKYQLNQALDIDYENTELLVMLELEFQSLEDYDPAFDPNAQGFFNNPALDFYESEGGNLKQFHGYKTNVASYHPNFAANEKVFKTKWYPIEDFGELLMALKIRTGYRNTNPQQNYPPSYMLAELLENRLVKARLKVLVDVGFDQVSYSGEKVRNTQVFTYNLFDESQGIDYLNYIEDEAVNDLVKYRPGKLVLKDEVLNSTSKKVFATVADELQVKAENIEVYGNITVPRGMTLVLEAKDELKVHPQASLPINTIMRINGSPYQFTKIMEQTNAQVRSFCQDQQNGYRANFLVAKQGGASFQDTSPEANANEFKIYPNPSSGIVQVKFGIASNWIRVSVHDLKGRLYLEEVLGEEFTKAFEVDLEDMKPGIYLLQIQNADGEFYSEKILRY